MGKLLYEELKAKAYDKNIPKQNVPAFIKDNLKFDLFDWQKNALENLLLFNAIKEKEQTQAPTHLLFHMATGTGKTLLMASVILYYYQKGYRHFLFFVNQKNILDKTRSNFIDTSHLKYLFKEKIQIENERVFIQEVDYFSPNPQGIEIKFTTIHKFHNDIGEVKENINTLEELKAFKLVMLADEAHHLNANTKKKQKMFPIFTLNEKAKKEDVEVYGWEGTVMEVLRQNPENVLLEFTATIPNEESVKEKYQDKILYEFALKEFFKAGFTKEINLLSFEEDKKERILIALLFNWYRSKIATLHHIPHFKSVILFRSKTIAESRQDFNNFQHMIERLNASDFDFLESLIKGIKESQDANEMGHSRLKTILAFIKKEKIGFAEIADWLKTYFSPRHVIITNSATNKKKTEEEIDENTEKLLNNLESKDNFIRGIFTVARLTEGWDVQNLFDIVRLDESQNAGGSDKKTPEATVQEMQLIGRGVRYFPFCYEDKQKNKCKFNDNLDHPLRILEELYFHTYDQGGRYIAHLKKELIKAGHDINEKVVMDFDLKANIRTKLKEKPIQILVNKQIENPHRQLKNLESIRENLKNFHHSFPILHMQEEKFKFDENDHLRAATNKQFENGEIFLKDYPHLFFKALAMKGKAGEFGELKARLKIESLKDLLNDQCLGNTRLRFTAETSDFNHLKSSHKLKMMSEFIDLLLRELKSVDKPYIGTQEFKPKKLLDVFSKPKQKLIEKEKLSGRKDFLNQDWFMLDNFVGKSEERALVAFIQGEITRLEKQYDEIYLLRNEEVYKIFDFETGQGFQPDFLLFLRNKNNTREYYQIIIEPKGEHLKEHDAWKEKFLETIQEKYGKKPLIKAENKDFCLIGLPFYHQQQEQAFSETFKTRLNLHP